MTQFPLQNTLKGKETFRFKMNSMLFWLSSLFLSPSILFILSCVSFSAIIFSSPFSSSHFILFLFLSFFPVSCFNISAVFQFSMSVAAGRETDILSTTRFWRQLRSRLSSVWGQKVPPLYAASVFPPASSIVLTFGSGGSFRGISSKHMKWKHYVEANSYLRTIPTERLPLVREVRAKFYG
jgi:hypothetical protein